MVTSYIFSGMGYSSGKFDISNDFIADAIRKGFLRGFDEQRMAKSDNYQAYKEKNPDVSPFDYFVREKMGFRYRKHVTPFPPTRKKLYYAESSLELGVRATEKALKDAGVKPAEIDAWFISTVSPNQKAPGIAAAIKSHFVGFNNYKPAFTITAGCSGFNTNLQRAIEYFEAHPEANHLVVGHTETMSSFLTQRVKFVPFVTFADGAAVMVLSRVQSETKQGVIAINNYHDHKMVDFVGVDINWNLYMDDSLIKDRAIQNIPEASLNAMSKSGWNINDIDLCIPHQTGNAILFDSVKMLGLPKDKLYLDAQHEYGNISGGTVPISYAKLKEEGKLTPGMKTISPMAGVGGNFGAFTYIVPNNNLLRNPIAHLHENDLKGKTAIVLGATGTVGQEICRELALRGANILMHYNRNKELADSLYSELNALGVEVKPLRADFNVPYEVKCLEDELAKQAKINFFVNAAGVLLSRKAGKVFNVNHYAPLQLFKSVFSKLKGTALFIGAAAEDINVPEIHQFISAKRALHGTLASMSGEVMKQGNYLVWYMPGVLDNGMLKNIEPKALYRFMVEIGQDQKICSKETAFRIVNSLYIPKTDHTNHSYENAMAVKRDSYKMEVDI